MSSEPLLTARSITKSYVSPLKTSARLRTALFGGSLRKEEAVEVLRGVDLEVFKGETVGILGMNGAGKTTLLGILGGILPASSGRIERKGSVVTLLGTGSGINRELTGRENVFSFCSVYGLTRKEVKQRLEDIRRFADIGKFFDFPARVYSSGMLARLSFACAAHIEADLIVIDETLAVGDAAFRLKCYDHIKTRQKQGQTYLLVSHSQGVVSSFCTRSLVLHEGKIIFDGPPLGAVNAYKELRLAMEMPDDLSIGKKIKSLRGKGPSQPLRIVEASHHVDDALRTHQVTFRFQSRRTLNDWNIAFGIRDRTGVIIAAFDMQRQEKFIASVRKGAEIEVSASFDQRLLPGPYFVSVSAQELRNGEMVPILSAQNALRIDVNGEQEAVGIVDLNLSINHKSTDGSHSQTGSDTRS